MYSALPSLNRTVTHLRAPHMLWAPRSARERRKALVQSPFTLNWPHERSCDKSGHACLCCTTPWNEVTSSEWLKASQMHTSSTVHYSGLHRGYPCASHQLRAILTLLNTYKRHTTAHKLDLTWEIQSEQNTRGATRPTWRERIVAASTLLTRHRC